MLLHFKLFYEWLNGCYSKLKSKKSIIESKFDHFFKMFQNQQLINHAATQCIFTNVQFFVNIIIIPIIMRIKVPTLTISIKLISNAQQVYSIINSSHTQINYIENSHWHTILKKHLTQTNANLQYPGQFAVTILLQMVPLSQIQLSSHSTGTEPSLSKETDFLSSRSHLGHLEGIEPMRL